MRYLVVPCQEAPGEVGFGIWDQRLSPLAVEEEKTPIFCSLDGETPLVFETMALAYRWLAKCERKGLDMEGSPGQVNVYSTGGNDGGMVMLSKTSSSRQTDPVIREWPMPWVDD